MTELEIKKKDEYRVSRFMYIIEAAVEYFVSILVTGAYFATLTSYIGISDSTTGLLSAFVSLGFSFQILALMIPRKVSSKKISVYGHLLEMLLFTALYVVPFFDISTNAKSAIIVVFLLGGRIISNLVYSPKIAWLMGLVDERQRGKFTAVKEMVSLISGMGFTLVMGRIVDIYKEKGNIEGAFLISAITLFSLTVVHTLSLILTKEKPKTSEEMKDGTVKKQLVSIFRNKNFWLVLPVLMCWSIANYVSTPFYNPYLIGELAFSMTVISVVGVIGSFTRATVSLPIGSLADKCGFSKMLLLCFSVMLVAFGSMIFATPETKFFYVIYAVLYAAGMAGMNSSEINLVLDYTSRELRVGAIAIKGLICGMTGFLTTLAAKPLVDYIQGNGNKLFGIHVYAQQLTSVISVFMCIVALVYMLTVIRKIKRN